MAYRFGPFLYDPVSRRLTSEGREIPLMPKGRELLQLFLENPGRLLRLDDITARVWPDVAVTDNSIRFQILELRKAIGPEGETFIRTLPREGYRWDAAVRREETRSPAARALTFRLLLEKREVELRDGENIVGRDHDAVLWIDHTAVSRHHARIVVEGDHATLEDLDSKNGTLLRGERIAGRVGLSDGDEIRIGPASMTFRVLSRAGSTETEQKG
jgi:DNA-binding winged helix-turn-helix (wHTH) protein